MNKSEFIDMLEKIGVPLNEGVQNDKNSQTMPRMVIQELVISPILASGQGYNDVVSYQISLFSKIPRPQALRDLREKLKTKGLNPAIYAEYVESNGGFMHYTCSVDVLENV